MNWLETLLLLIIGIFISPILLVSCIVQHGDGGVQPTVYQGGNLSAGVFIAIALMAVLIALVTWIFHEKLNLKRWLLVTAATSLLCAGWFHVEGSKINFWQKRLVKIGLIWNDYEMVRPPTYYARQTCLGVFILASSLGIIVLNSERNKLTIKNPQQHTA